MEYPPPAPQPNTRYLSLPHGNGLPVQSRVIAVVEDEADTLELVSVYLRNAGFEVEGFGTGGGFRNYVGLPVPDRPPTGAQSGSMVPDLVILDLALPDADGLDICRDLRREHRIAHVPVVMLTARAGESERVQGLDAGADDYVTKPFSPRELVSRVRAVLRRSTEWQAPRQPVRVGPFELDSDRFTVRFRGRVLDLTATEFRVIELLCRAPGQVFTRAQIVEGIRGYERPVTGRTVDTHICNIREKLGPAGSLIRSVRGVGYRLSI